MLGGYAAFTLLGWGAGYWGALVLVPILVGIVGWGLEELGIRPLLPRADRAIVTLASHVRRQPDPSGHCSGHVGNGDARRGGAVHRHRDASPRCSCRPTGSSSSASALMAIFATWWLVYRTRLGAVLRATAVDPSMVASFGIPIRLVYGLTFIYGCGLAGLAGVLLSPIYAVFPTMGHDFLVMAFAVVIVGGMGSIIGAVVAALLLAQVQGLASLWIPPVWAETLVYGVMLLVLVARPAGCSTGLERRDAPGPARPARRPQPCGLNAAAKHDVGDRLLRALYPPQSERSAVALARLRDACARRSLSVAGRSFLHASGDRGVVCSARRAQRRHSARLCRTAVARAGRLFWIGRLHLGIDVLCM